MQNFNDYYYFVQVVKYQGFTKASEALGITKSKLSRRISELESRLNVKLIQRNTRKFTVTEIGYQFYNYCLQIIENVQAAENFVHDALTNEPSGTIKISCPVALVEKPVGEMIANFMQQYSAVNVHLVATNERVDLIEEGIDLAIRVRHAPLEDSDLIVRQLDVWEHILVATPNFIQKYQGINSFEDLQQLPSIGFRSARQTWYFKSAETQQTHQLEIQPRLKTDNFTAIKSAVLADIGIASLPKMMVQAELEQQKLIHLLPDWYLPSGLIHVVYPSREGMPPAVRLLLEHLIAEFKHCPGKHTKSI